MESLTLLFSPNLLILKLVRRGGVAIERDPCPNLPFLRLSLTAVSQPNAVAVSGLLTWRLTLLRSRQRALPNQRLSPEPVPDVTLWDRRHSMHYASFLMLGSTGVTLTPLDTTLDLRLGRTGLILRVEMAPSVFPRGPLLCLLPEVKVERWTPSFCPILSFSLQDLASLYLSDSSHLRSSWWGVI